MASDSRSSVAERLRSVLGGSGGRVLSTAAERLPRLVDDDDDDDDPGPDTAGSAAVDTPPLDGAVDDVTVGLAVFDDALRFRYLNDAARSLLDLHGSSVVGRDVRDVVGMSEAFVDALTAALDGESSVLCESRPAGDLETMWVEYDVSPSAAGATVVLDDVSDRKRLERELRTEKEQFRTALQNSPLVAFRLDTDLRYTWVGNAHEDFDETTVVGKRDDDLLPPAAAEVVTAPKRRVLETGEGVREEVTYDLPSGEVTYDLTVEPLRDETGELVGITSAALDITEQRQRERQLREQNERLDRITEVLSHDLRGPLSVATGRLALFEMDEDPEHLDAVRQAHERMSTLIDDVLAASRAPDTVDETTTVPLQRVAREAWAQVETDGAVLEVAVDDDHTVEANESQLAQLFENLFRNSVDHGVSMEGATDDGDDPPVTVCVGSLDGREGFYVEDDGEGLALPPAETDRAFEDGYSTSQTGTGLGLGIVRDVATAHGWTVCATDAEEGGARFEFRPDSEATTRQTGDDAG